VDWAVAQGARIIALSAGGFDSNITLSNALTEAIAKGVVVIAAAHNDGGPIRFPARLPSVIAVGATTMTDARAPFSNFGRELSLVAPGTNIYSVSRLGRTQREWGTSLAVPQVAGAAALILALRPELGPDQVRELLCAGADDLVGTPTEDTPGFDRFHGYGRLNVNATLRLALTQLRVRRQGNRWLVSWLAPSNADVKRPFGVEVASRPEGPWKPIPSAAVSYESDTASWLDDTADAAPQRFYRLRIQKN
jgi:subtilisin family serine protease